MKTRFEYTIKKVSSEEERREIKKLVKRFWGEQEQLTFDKSFKVAELPAYVAKVRRSIIGFVTFVLTRGAVLIVALGILPKYQGSGVGTGLVRKVEDEARRANKKRLHVSTSNDDLPALAFYQSLGFQIYEVKPNVIAEKHGEFQKGIGRLPIRDELRLQKYLA